MMKKTMIWAAAGSLVIGSACLTACSASSAAAPASVQANNVESEDGRVTLTTSETVKVTPDMAQIVYAVTTEDEDAAECQQQNAAHLDQLLQYLRSAGVEESSIQTSGYYLDTLYDWSGDQRLIVGYDMRTEVTVTDIPVEQVGAMLTQGVEAGANEINSVTYFASGYDEAYSEALTKAVELSKTKAEALAAAGGKTVGQVLSMEEYGADQYGRYVDSGISRSGNALAASENIASDMGVMPGEMEVTATITVAYELLGGE